MPNKTTTKYAVLSRGSFGRKFTHFFGVQFSKTSKCVGVQKRTNMRYVRTISTIAITPSTITSTISISAHTIRTCAHTGSTSVSTFAIQYQQVLATKYHVSFLFESSCMLTAHSPSPLAKIKIKMNIHTHKPKLNQSKVFLKSWHCQNQFDTQFILVTTATTGDGVLFSSWRTFFHRERKRNCFEQSLSGKNI